MPADIEIIMKNLGVSEEEAKEILISDKEIDRGAKLFELDPELEAGAKKARRAERKTTAPVKREKKVNPTKREIIQYLDEALCDLVDNVEEITNPEREIIFWYNDVKYKLTLSCPRS